MALNFHLRSRLRTCILVFGCACWPVAVGACWAMLASYDRTPGDSGAAAVRWPAGVALARASERPTLLLFAHPQCPCTRASLHELGRILSAADAHPPKTYVILLHPEGYPDKWTQSSLWEQATAVPGVTTISDPGGALARSFGANTSGQVLLFSPSGALVFAGGITASRGHEGASRGSDAVQEFLRTGETRHPRSRVFGCSLTNPTGSRV